MIANKTISWGYPVPIHTTIVARVKRESNGIVSIEVECQNKKVSFELKPENALDVDQMNNLKKEINNMQF